MAEDMINVRYYGNIDPRDATEVIELDGDRNDIQLEGVGQVTQGEFARLTERGIGLEVITSKEVEEELSAPSTHSHGSLTHEHAMDFISMSASDLQSLADAHEMTVTGSGTGGKIVKKDLEDALAAAHA